MSEILFCTIVVALSLIAIVAIVGMTIYHISKIQTLSMIKNIRDNNLSEKV